MFAGVTRTHVQSADCAAEAIASAAEDLEFVEVGVAAIRATWRLFEPFGEAVYVKMVSAVGFESGVGL